MPRHRPPRRFVRLRESGSTATAVLDRPSDTTELVESSTDGATATATPRRYRVRLIKTDVWGSSGWYGREVVARDGPQVWPIGTHLYIDHPTATEEVERPERSIRDLAAHIVTTPILESDGLYSEIEVVPHWAAFVASLKDIIGLSIRADGMAESGTRQGRTGPVVTAITHGHSVDLVTKAGAGGAIVSLLEAARERNVPIPLAESPTEQIRQALERVIRAAYGVGEHRYAWIRDFDPDRNVVWFDTDGDGLAVPAISAGTWEQTYATNGVDVALLGPRRPVTAVTVYRPIAEAPAFDTSLGESADTNPTTDVTDGAPPTGSTTPTPSEEESAMAETSTGTAPAAAGIDVAAIQIEAREAVTARDKAISERDTALTEAATQKARADKAEAELATFRAVEAARPLIAAQLAESGLPVAAQNKVTAAATARVPLTESRQLDLNGLRVLVEAEIAGEKAYVAQLQEAAGAGQVTGFGQAPAQQAPAATSWAAPVEPNAALIESYQRRGLSAEAARLAAVGRAV